MTEASGSEVAAEKVPLPLTMDVYGLAADGTVENRELSKPLSEVGEDELWFFMHTMHMVSPKAFAVEEYASLLPAGLLIPYDLAYAQVPETVEDHITGMFQESSGDAVGIIDFVDSLLISRERWWRDAATEGQRKSGAYVAACCMGKEIATACGAVLTMLLHTSRAMRGEPDSFVQAFAPREAFTPDMADLSTAFEPVNIQRMLRSPILSEWLKSVYRQHIRMLVGIGSLEPTEVMSELRAAYRDGRVSVGLLDEIETMLPKSIDTRIYLKDHKRRDIRRSRRVLRRSIEGFRRMFGSRMAASLHEFLRGRPLRAEGVRYDWSFTPRWSAVLHGIVLNRLHCPFIIGIHDKGSQQRVASLCVYFDETPLVDMLAAMLMHIRSREGEERLIHEGNLYAVTDRCRADDFLRGLKPTQVTERPMPDVTPLSPFMEAFLSDDERAAASKAKPLILREIQRASMIPAQPFAILSAPFTYTEEKASARMQDILLERAVI